MLKKIILNDLHPQIVCILCNGYLIDPVTLVECVHSFCKTCIVKHVDTNKTCPVCEVQIHKTRPFLNMKSDKTLENIVYKLVPGLLKNEMDKRKKFQEKHEPTKVSKEELEKHFFFRDDKISMSIEYYDPQNPEGSPPEKNNPNRRYLECPGTVKVQHLMKFIAMKYGLNENFEIDIIYMDHLIPEDYTLIDVAYYYNWKKDAPMKFFYRIFKKSRVLLKRRKRKLETEESQTTTASEVKKSKTVEDSNTKNGGSGVSEDDLSGRDQSVDIRSCAVKQSSGNEAPKDSTGSNRAPSNQQVQYSQASSPAHSQNQFSHESTTPINNKIQYSQASSMALALSVQFSQTSQMNQSSQVLGYGKVGQQKQTNQPSQQNQINQMSHTSQMSKPSHKGYSTQAGKSSQQGHKGYSGVMAKPSLVNQISKSPQTGQLGSVSKVMSQGSPSGSTSNSSHVAHNLPKTSHTVPTVQTNKPTTSVAQTGNLSKSSPVSQSSQKSKSSHMEVSGQLSNSPKVDQESKSNQLSQAAQAAQLAKLTQIALSAQSSASAGQTNTTTVISSDNKKPPSPSIKTEDSLKPPVPKKEDFKIETKVEAKPDPVPIQAPKEEKDEKVDSKKPIEQVRELKIISLLGPGKTSIVSEVTKKPETKENDVPTKTTLTSSVSTGATDPGPGNDKTFSSSSPTDPKDNNSKAANGSENQKSTDQSTLSTPSVIQTVSSPVQQKTMGGRPLKPGCGSQILSVINNLAKKQQNLEASSNNKDGKVPSMIHGQTTVTKQVLENGTTPSTLADVSASTTNATTSSSLPPKTHQIPSGTTITVKQVPTSQAGTKNNSVVTPNIRASVSTSSPSLSNLKQSPTVSNGTTTSLSTTTSNSTSDKPKPVVADLRQFRKAPSDGSTATSTPSRPPIIPQLTNTNRVKSTGAGTISTLHKQPQPGSHRLPASTSAAGGIASSRPLNLTGNCLNRIPTTYSNTLSPADQQKALQLLRHPIAAMSMGNPMSSMVPTSLPTTTSTMSSSPTTTSQPTSVTAAQLPSNRLQLKVPPPTTGISPFQAAFQSSVYTQAMESIWKQQQQNALQASIQASVNNGKVLSGLSKTLNQGIRQIPNPSQLTKQHQQHAELMMAMAASVAASARSTQQ